MLIVLTTWPSAWELSRVHCTLEFAVVVVESRHRVAIAHVNYREFTVRRLYPFDLYVY